jgi:hypothetical protein
MNKKVFNVTMTMIMVVFIVIFFNIWSITSSLVTLHKEVNILHNEINNGYERDLDRLKYIETIQDAIVQLHSEDTDALKRDLKHLDYIEANQEAVVNLQKSVIELKDEKIKDLELETLPQVLFKGQYPHPALHAP